MYEQYSSQEFEEKYTYSGNLGAFWTPEKTAFRLWAPTAETVSIRLYRSGDPGADDLLAQLRMQPDVCGTWTAERFGNLNGIYYTYLVTVDGQTYPLPEPFVVLATQNPVGSAGTQLLPAAQLDRFLIRTSMGYPDAKSQIDILKERHHENPLDKLTAAVSREQLLSLMNDARQVHISDPVYAYVVDLVTATRENEFIELGVSPRGALALCRMAKSCAFVRGRDYVIPEDVAAVFDDVCCHRLVLSAKARLHRLSAADVTAEIVKTVKMPQVQEK